MVTVRDRQPPRKVIKIYLLPAGLKNYQKLNKSTASVEVTLACKDGSYRKNTRD